MTSTLSRINRLRDQQDDIRPIESEDDQEHFDEIEREIDAIRKVEWNVRDSANAKLESARKQRDEAGVSGDRDRFFAACRLIQQAETEIRNA